jgi:hypothetical protein
MPLHLTGADANAQESVCGDTPLHILLKGSRGAQAACRWGRGGGARVKLLLERGAADPEIRNGEGEGAMHLVSVGADGDGRARCIW